VIEPYYVSVLATVVRRGLDDRPGPRAENRSILSRSRCRCP